jgi:hypothetical protein
MAFIHRQSNPATGRVQILDSVACEIRRPNQVHWAQLHPGLYSPVRSGNLPRYRATQIFKNVFLPWCSNMVAYE